jgi:hypothetical protein
MVANVLLGSFSLVKVKGWDVYNNGFISKLEGF